MGIHVRATTTTNGLFASAFANGGTIDGVTLETGDIILIKNQTTGSENGCYQVNASGAPTRIYLLDSTNANQFRVLVGEGTVNKFTNWICTNSFGSDVVGTDSLVFQQNPISFIDNNITSSSSSISTNSTTYVLITGMTITPGAGTYLVMFSAVGYNSTPALGTLSSYILYNNGSSITDSERDYTIIGNLSATNQRVSLHTQTITTVSDGQAIEAYYKVNVGTYTFNIEQRSLILIKLA